ncbi:MAG: hypothetical protein WEB88_04940 [Gemmatimonadota bacterium]
MPAAMRLHLGAPPARIALAAALLLLAAAALLAPRLRNPAPDGVHYTPSSDAPRPGQERLLHGVVDVTDFESWGDTLAILDGAGHTVAVYGPDGSDPLLTFGTEGSGPGELRRPTSLARLPDGRLVVADLPALHVFERNGGHVETLRPALPCLMNAGRIRRDAGGGYLSGNCAGGPGAGDTLFAAVLHSPDLRRWSILTRAPRITVDGRWGSVYTPIEAFGEGEARHFFGLGLRDCLVVIEAVTGGTPTTREQCGVAPRPFSIPEPPRRGANPAGRTRGPAFDWPDPMIRWLIVAAVDEAPVLGRAFSTDSVTFHAAAEGGAPPPDLLVADGDVVTCRRGRCLWRTAEAEGVRIHMADLSALMDAAEGR